MGTRIVVIVVLLLAAGCTGVGDAQGVSEATEPGETSVDLEDPPSPSTGPEPEPERVMDPGAAQIVAGEAEWMGVTILHVDVPDDLEELEDPRGALLWSGVIVAERPGVELDLERPWRGYGQGVVALDPEARHLLVSVFGALDVCHSFGGVDIDAGSEEVRLAPRFVAPLGYWGGCIQPGPGVASAVDLGEPLGERTLTLQRCVGEGWGDCEDMERYEPGDLPLAGRTTVHCVPVHNTVLTQRAIHDMLVLCDPDAEPMQGIVD